MKCCRRPCVAAPAAQSSELEWPRLRPIRVLMPDPRLWPLAWTGAGLAARLAPQRRQGRCPSSCGRSRTSFGQACMPLRPSCLRASVSGRSFVVNLVWQGVWLVLKGAWPPTLQAVRCMRQLQCSCDVAETANMQLAAAVSPTAQQPETCHMQKNLRASLYNPRSQQRSSVWPSRACGLCGMPLHRSPQGRPVPWQCRQALWPTGYHLQSCRQVPWHPR
mmetsp:Transcript_63787/g.181154  ORF Transcript_63787/g.181154 Transcript_63787/m.181154 type:complete len:219 (+) Transcript_63787:1463-2119(+)